MRQSFPSRPAKIMRGLNWNVAGLFLAGCFTGLIFALLLTSSSSSTSTSTPSPSSATIDTAHPPLQNTIRPTCTAEQLHPNIRHLFEGGKPSPIITAQTIDRTKVPIIDEYFEVLAEREQDADFKGHIQAATVRGVFDIGVWVHYFKPAKSLEIGFAGGGSTFQILAAHLGREEPGQHIAVDPYESHWGNIGVKYTNRLIEKALPRLSQSTLKLPSPFFEDQFLKPIGEGNLFAWYENRSAIILNRLMDLRQKFDLIFLDGGHLFEENIYEAHFATRILNQDGLLLLHDTWMPSVQSAINFLITNLPYCEVISVNNVAVLQRIGPDRRNWDHYTNFNAETIKTISIPNQKN